MKLQVGGDFARARAGSILWGGAARPRWGKLEFKCKLRGMETCLHSRDAALNAREAGI